MDLTRFMHGGPGRVLYCRTCGTLVRDEEAQARYDDDVYDSVLMSHLYPRYLRAFEQKRSQYRPMLRSGAEVLEVGSHLGAFLQVAEEWGWRPIGLDIGESTSTFARRRGAFVRRLAIEAYSPRLRPPEAIFIWNCFEQLQDPSAALRRAHQVLDRHGLLILRVPNAAFYRNQRQLLETIHAKRALRLLAYNNLLAFPYLHGYSLAALNHFLRAHHFEPIAENDSTLLTPPYPDMPARAREEWRRVCREGKRVLAVGGPWIEVVSRRRAD
jgi:hypothetical protein